MPEFIDAGTQDFMSRSTLLRQHCAARMTFDPADPAHRESLRIFIESGNWGAVQFHIEFPYTDVPMTVLRKFARFILTQVITRETDRCGALNIAVPSIAELLIANEKKQQVSAKKQN